MGLFGNLFGKKDMEEQGILYKNTEKVAKQSSTQPDLEYVAKYDSDQFERWDAVKKITNLSVLEYVAINESVDDVGLAAFYRIKDNPLANKSIIANIAKNAKHPTVRYHATGRLTDRDVLNDIAQNDNNSNVRKIAMEVLKT